MVSLKGVATVANKKVYTIMMVVELKPVFRHFDRFVVLSLTSRSDA